MMVRFVYQGSREKQGVMTIPLACERRSIVERWRPSLRSKGEKMVSGTVKRSPSAGSWRMEMLQTCCKVVRGICCGKEGS